MTCLASLFVFFVDFHGDHRDTPVLTHPFLTLRSSALPAPAVAPALPDGRDRRLDAPALRGRVAPRPPRADRARPHRSSWPQHRAACPRSAAPCLAAIP